MRDCLCKQKLPIYNLNRVHLNRELYHNFLWPKNENNNNKKLNDWNRKRI